MRFSYDNLGRMIDEQWLEADGVTEVNRIFYTFDVASQLTAVTDDFSSYSLTYDALGRAETIDNLGTPNSPRLILTNAYDAVGNRTSVSTNVDGTDDFINSWQYDDLNRATQVTQTSQTGGNSVADKRVDLSYNARGQFSIIDRFADLSATQSVATSTYGYDDRGRITSLVHATNNSDPTALNSYSWVWDAADRVTSSSSNDGTSAYSYDDTSQVTGAVHSYQQNETYTYDANGNRLTAESEAVGGSSTTYTTGTNNQLLSDGVFNFTYDDEGNRLTKTTIATGESVEYAWDHRNRLIDVTFRNGTGTVTKTVENTYDSQNRRIVKSVDDDGDGTDDRRVSYLYDSSGKPDPATGVPLDDIVLVYVDPDADGAANATLDSRLLHGPAIDQVFAQEDSSNHILWALGDHQGTIRDWVEYDDVGDTTSVVNHIEFDVYGNITEVEDGAGNSASLATALTTIHFAYTGRDFDNDIGLQNNRARWYDSVVGRWISEDPIGFAAGDSNITRYAFNGPVIGIDPSGLDRWSRWGLRDELESRLTCCNCVSGEGGNQLQHEDYLIGIQSRPLSDEERIALNVRLAQERILEICPTIEKFSTETCQKWESVFVSRVNAERYAGRLPGVIGVQTVTFGLVADDTLPWAAYSVWLGLSHGHAGVEVTFADGSQVIYDNDYNQNGSHIFVYPEGTWLYRFAPDVGPAENVVEILEARDWSNNVHQDYYDLTKKPLIGPSGSKQ